MNESRMRDALLAAEPSSPELENRYRERLRALTEHDLTTTERAGIGIGLAGAAGVAAWFVWLLRTQPMDHRPLGAVTLWVGLALCAGWGAYAIAVLRPGTQDARRDGSVVAQLVALSTGMMIVLLFWQGVHLPDASRGNQKLLIALLVWTMAGLPYWVTHLVREHSLRLRADLLRLDLAIAELGERREPPAN